MWPQAHAAGGGTCSHGTTREGGWAAYRRRRPWKDAIAPGEPVDRCDALSGEEQKMGMARRAGVSAIIAALMLSAAAKTGGPVLAAGVAPDGPGTPSFFDLARKDCVGTAQNTTSKVWYTVADGVLSDTYFPTIDNTNVKTLQFIVTDGSTFTDLQTRDMTYTVQRLGGPALDCHVTATADSGKYRIVTDYLTDPN